MEQLELRGVTSLFVTVFLATLIVGYGRAIVSRQGAVFHLVACIVLVFSAYVWRTNYWDLPFWFEAKMIWGGSVNVFFDALVIWGGIHGHIAILKMIPEHDRNKWSVLTAWLYPPVTLLGPFRMMLERVRKWRP